MSRLISNWLLVYKLALPASALVVATLVTIVAAWHWRSSVESEVSAVIDRDARRQELSLSIQADFLRGALISRDVRLASTPEELESLAADNQQLEARIESELDLLSGLMIQPERKQLAADCIAAFRDWEDAIQTTIAGKLETLRTGTERPLGGKGRIARASLEALVAKIVANSRGDMETAKQAAIGTGRNAALVLVIGSGAAQLSALALLVWITVAQVSSPLNRMAAAMERLAAGDLDVPVTGAGRRDEVGTLARSLQVFKDNAIALRTAHRAVEQANAALERRVEERTAELKEAQEELIRRERLSILGQVTATVAHELRNPLATIRNTLYAARQASAAAAVLERPFKRMERALERCDLIIAELLDYTRVRELRSEIAAFDEWLGGVLDEQIPPSGIVLERDFRSGGAALAFDRDRLRRVVINLVDNAAQAITGAETPRAEPRITVRTCLDEEHLELTIEDTGPGIRPEHLPKLFEPLFSTKSSGTGLGLPTVRQIVEQHGGDIRVDSTLGSGTRVIIRLPHGREGGRAAA